MNLPCRSPRRLLAFSDRSALLLVVIACLANLMACGTPQSGVGSSALLVQPANLDFGSVSPGSRAAIRTVKITNLGILPIKLQGLSIAPSPAFSVQNWHGPVTLRCGQSYQVLVGFTPKIESNYSGTLLLSVTYDPNTGGSGLKLQPSGGIVLPHLSQKVILQAKASTSNNTPSVSLLPTSISLRSGQGYQFKASVTGSNKEVTWTASLGSITSSGWYTAPRVSQKASDTVLATSVANPNSQAVALVSVNPTNFQNTQTVTVSVFPNSATVRPGASMQFTSQVTGTTVTGVTWTAALGSITSSGIYTAPSGLQTVDTISAVSVADPTKYANASVSVENANSWTVANQQPVTQEYYPGSLVTTPLRPDVGSHLDVDSSAIIDTVMGGGASAAYTVLTNLNSQSTAVAQQAFYYSDVSSPIYKVLSCSNVPSNSKYSPIGKYFHLTSGASPSSQNGDSFLLLWDQSTDIDSTVGGRILSFYNPHTPLGSCACRTTSCADSTPSCQVSSTLGDGWGRYCEIGFPSEDVIYGTDKSSGGYSSLQFQAAAGFLRDNEIISGTVDHALILNAHCTSAPYVVFPATGFGVSQCSGNWPHAGSLIYIDSGYDCFSLPQWQQGACRAMQTYGGYVSDTGGPSSGFYVIRAEGGMAYATAGIAWPFLVYAQTQSGNGFSLRGSPVNGANLPFFNMPGVSSHMHVAAPCVAMAMAGMSAAEGACP